MRWNGDSTLFAAVRYYRCIPQRTTRGSNGLRTVIRRPPVRLQKCGRLPGKLEAARKSGKEEAAPPHLHAARQCVRACATADAGTNLRPGSRVRHARASRARRCPMDATRRLASRPRHVRDGTARRMRARHPTRNRVYTLATPRGIEIRIRTKQTNKTEGAQQGAQPKGCPTGCPTVPSFFLTDDGSCSVCFTLIAAARQTSHCAHSCIAWSSLPRKTTRGSS